MRPLRFCALSVLSLLAGHLAHGCCEGGTRAAGIEGCVYVAECFSPEKSTELRDRCSAVANGLPYIPIACELSVTAPDVCRFHDSFETELCDGEPVRIGCCREDPDL